MLCNCQRRLDKIGHFFRNSRRSTNSFPTLYLEVKGGPLQALRKPVGHLFRKHRYGCSGAAPAKMEHLGHCILNFCLPRGQNGPHDGKLPTPPTGRAQGNMKTERRVIRKGLARWFGAPSHSPSTPQAFDKHSPSTPQALAKPHPQSLFWSSRLGGSVVLVSVNWLAAAP